MHNKTYIPAIGWIISVGGWFAFNLILSVVYKAGNPIYYVRSSITTRFGRSLDWWVVLIIIVTATLFFEISISSLKRSFLPSDADVFQELEKDPVIRQRFRDAVEEKETMGEDVGVEMKSSLEISREREREVQELLSRPRVMDFEAGDVGGSGELHHRRRSDDMVSPTAVEGENAS